MTRSYLTNVVALGVVLIGGACVKKPVDPGRQVDTANAKVGETGRTQPLEFLTDSLKDAGQVVEGVVLKEEFAWANRSSSTVQIVDLQRGCGCSNVTVSSKTVPPGEGVTATLFVETVGKSGDLLAEVVMRYTTGDDRGELKFGVSSVVGKKYLLVPEPAVIDFGDLSSTGATARPFELRAIVLGEGAYPLPPNDGARTTSGVRARRAGDVRYQTDGRRRIAIVPMEAVLPEPPPAGEFDETVRFESTVDSAVVQGYLVLRGRGQSLVRLEADSVYLGSVPRAEPTTKTLRVLSCSVASLDQLDLRASRDWITARFAGPDAVSDRRLEVSVSPPTSVPLFEEWIDVVARNGDRLRVPIVGMVP